MALEVEKIPVEGDTDADFKVGDEARLLININSKEEGFDKDSFKKEFK